MELLEVNLTDLEHATIPAWCSAFAVYSLCDENEGPIVLVMYEEIEPVKKTA